uniref:Uncharacterized protein n=1 Tax=Salix viminalis TaxID=40686 RepID=A0A6N2M5U1_SALVM
MANEFKQIIYPLQLICNQYWLINSQRLQEDFLSRTRLPSDNNSSFDEAGLLERSTRDGFKKEKVNVVRSASAEETEFKNTVLRY